MKRIDKKTPFPLAFQLKKQLKEQINKKVYLPGKPIPSRSTLAKKIGISQQRLAELLGV